MTASQRYAAETARIEQNAIAARKATEEMLRECAVNDALMAEYERIEREAAG